MTTRFWTEQFLKPESPLHKQKLDEIVGIRNFAAVYSYNEFMQNGPRELMSSIQVWGQETRSIRLRKAERHVSLLRSSYRSYRESQISWQFCEYVRYMRQRPLTSLLRNSRGRCTRDCFDKSYPRTLLYNNLESRLGPSLQSRAHPTREEITRNKWKATAFRTFELMIFDTETGVHLKLKFSFEGSLVIIKETTKPDDSN